MYILTTPCTELINRHNEWWATVSPNHQTKMVLGYYWWSARKNNFLLTTCKVQPKLYKTQVSARIVANRIRNKHIRDLYDFNKFTIDIEPADQLLLDSQIEGIPCFAF